MILSAVDSGFLPALLIPAFIVLLTYFVYSARAFHSKEEHDGLPRVNTTPGFGIELAMLEKLSQNSLRVANKVGRIFGIWMTNPWGTFSIQVSHPKIVREILQSDWETYDRGHEDTKVFEDLGGGLILQPNGPHWREARTLFDRFFTAASIRTRMVPILKSELSVLIRALDEKASKSEPFDIQRVFQHFTFDTITRVVFGQSIGSLEKDGSTYLDAFNACQASMIQRFVWKWLLPSFLLDGGAKYKRDIKHFWSLVTDRLDEYDQKVKSDVDVKQDEHFTDDSILGTLLGKDRSLVPDWMWEDRTKFVKQLVSILFAGHDTTTNLLSWVMHFLYENPEVQEQLYAEIVESCGPEEENGEEEVGKGITLEKVENLKLLNAVIKETLRIRPSATSLPRLVSKDTTWTWSDETNRTHTHNLKQGQLIAYEITTAHQHPANWPYKPQEWDPYRWIPTHLQSSPRSGDSPTSPTSPTGAEGASGHHIGGATSVYAYIPFGYGPRRCLGERLALAEARLTIAHIVRRYKIEGVKAWKVDILEELTMKAKWGIGVQFSKRS